MEQNIIEQFKSLDITPDKKNLEKCVTFCTTYDITPEDFINKWIAFTLSNNLDSDPSSSALQLFERKELSLNQTPRKPKSLKIYNSSPKTPIVDDIVTSYLTHESSQIERTPKRRLQSPNDDSIKRRQASKIDGISFVANTFDKPGQPSPVQSTKYSERVDSGAIQLSFGDPDQLSKTTWKGKNIDATVKNLIPVKSYLYMNDNIYEQVYGLIEFTNWIAQLILEKNQLNKPRSITDLILKPETVYGRIYPKSGEIKIESVLNESSGQKVSTDLKRIPEYYFYPGQVVVATTTNTSGDKLKLEQIYHEAAAPLPRTKFSIRGSSLQIVVACGPYTLDDNLSYEPLTDFITYIKTNKPDIVIMIGPFVDVEHKEFSSGYLAESFYNLFERLIARVMESLEELQTQVILIPSYRDSHHTPVYPTPPYILSQRYPRLHCMPDPAHISINGLVISITAADILKQLSRVQLCKTIKNSDPVGKLVSHLIAQRCIYPLMRESCLPEVPLDIRLWTKLGKLKCTPHIMILPSQYKYFVKNINNCVVINPEKLAKGDRGGTFARIEVSGAQNDQDPLINNIICQIIKV